MSVRRSIVAATFFSAIVIPAWLSPAGSVESPPANEATCTPSGNALSITASDNKFDNDCLAAPADQAFTIEFKNEDWGIPHNVSIYDTSNGAEKTLFEGEVTEGPKTITYNVPAIPAGKYEFRCDPHPEFMVGTFISG